jgi:hypothetical protein
VDVVTCERLLIAGVAHPHAGAHLERILEQVETSGEGRERDSQAVALLLVVAGPDAEPGPPPGEHVEGGHGLGQYRGMAKVRPGRDGQQPKRATVAGEGRQGGVRLEARRLRAAHHRVLPHLIRRRDAVEATAVSQSGDVGQQCAEPSQRRRPVEL